MGTVLDGAGAVLNPGGITTTVITVGLFLVIGLTLPAEQVRTGGKNVRFHLTAQLFIFLITPVAFFALSRLFVGYFDGMLATGIVAVGVLPTTVSSCVVLTQSSEGNTVAAVFNAAFANLIGVVVSPAILSFLLSRAGGGLAAEEILVTYRNLALQMLLPIGVGQLIRFLLKERAVKLKKPLSTAANAAIVSVVFFTVSRSAANPEFTHRLLQLPVPFLGLAFAHLLLLGAAMLVASLLKMPREDRVALGYVAPQKTLALGAPLLTTYFASSPEVLGVAILPVLFYHLFQLLVAGLLRGTVFAPNKPRPEQAAER